MADHITGPNKEEAHSSNRPIQSARMRRNHDWHKALTELKPHPRKEGQTDPQNRPGSSFLEMTPERAKR